jgi:hypothetical protein
MRIIHHEGREEHKGKSRFGSKEAREEKYFFVVRLGFD